MLHDNSPQVFLHFKKWSPVLVTALEIKVLLQWSCPCDCHGIVIVINHILDGLVAGYIHICEDRHEYDTNSCDMCVKRGLSEFEITISGYSKVPCSADGVD